MPIRRPTGPRRRDSRPKVCSLCADSAVADAQQELSELLGVPVDVVPVEQAKPRLAQAIQREAPPL